MEQVRGQDRGPRLGKTFGHFLCQPLDAGADGGHLALDTTTGTGSRNGLGRPALVTDQTVLEPMLDHAGIALIAADLLAAGPAGGDWRIAAPVQKQQRLLAPRLPRADFPRQRRADPAALFHLFGAQVDGAHLGQLGGAIARAQVQPGIFAAGRIDPAFDRGRGRGQHHLRLPDAGAQHRHVAGGIIDHVFLLVAGIMLFIDDDQPQIGKGQEQGRTRAHHHANMVFGRHHPQPAPLGPGDAGMPFARTRAEPGLDPVQKLRRQRDLGQQHQRLPALPQTFRHRLKVNLGLARAGDTAQQGGAIGAALHRLPQQCRRIGLIRRQGFAGQVRVQPRKRQVARRAHLGQRASLDQPLHHAAADPGQLRQLAWGKAGAAVILDHPQHGGAGVGHAFGRRPRAMDDAPRRRRLVQIRRPRRHTQHQGQRRQGIFAHPRQEFDHPRGQWRSLDQPRDGTQLGHVEIAHARPPDRAHHPARAQRHHDQLSQPHPPLGRKIVEHADHLLRQHRDAGAMRIEQRLVHLSPADPATAGSGPAASSPSAPARPAARPEPGGCWDHRLPSVSLLRQTTLTVPRARQPLQPGGGAMPPALSAALVMR